MPSRLDLARREAKTEWGGRAAREGEKKTKRGRQRECG